ncbi:glycosyltransferase [Gemmatimonadota bacterium]
MKVVHLEAGTHLYGGALQVLLLVEGLAARGVDSLLVVPSHSTVEREARSRGLPVHPIPMAGEGDLPFIARFRRLIQAVKPDLVHLHSRRGADTLGAMAAHWAGVPVVLSRRVDNPEVSWAVGPKYRLYSAVIAISEAIRKVLVSQGVPAGKVHCVHSSLDPGPFQEPCRQESFLEEFGLAPGDPVVGMAAQFIPRKGHDVLLEAVGSIREDHPRARFLLFGQGPLLDQVTRQIREAGLSEVVSLPGFREDLPRILPCLDLLVHPATREGLGIILLQASAAGVPIVASRAGGIPEAVIHGKTGLLVSPGDPGALAGAVSALLSDGRRARAMGEAGRRHVLMEFSPDRMVEGNLQVYRELLAPVH